MLHKVCQMVFICQFYVIARNKKWFNAVFYDFEVIQYSNKINKKQHAFT